MDPMIYIGLKDRSRIAFKSKLMKTITRVRKSFMEEAYEVILNHLDVTDREIRSANRRRKLAVSRQILSHILVHRYKAKVVEVARMLNRHHATIIYSCDTASDLLATDKGFKNKYNATVDRLKSKGFK